MHGEPGVSTKTPDRASCQHPLDSAILADYWGGLLDGADEQSVEEHLLGCDGCGARLTEVVALLDAVRDLAREGSLRMVVSDAFLRRAADDGLRIREYTVAPGDSVNCTVTADDDLLVGRLLVDLGHARRVDLCFCDERGVERQRFSDIPLQAASGNVAFQESITIAKASPSYTMIARLVDVGDSGEERVLGEYTFRHTRSLPGPGSRSA
jgi:hypothetical protein